MNSRPHSICLVTTREESDTSIYGALKFGYDAAKQA